ncbi:MAG: hypothetical protein HZC38_19730 [Chloroflexi bacterium]|nr:hypothetical protein [Chloroflexota bacterium]MBI5715635.1 hypothetical protein [Chloroflexota bacterium]
MRKCFVLVAIVLTACGSDSTRAAATRISNRVSPPTAAVAATVGQLACGAEAAIILAQTQSDLALAAIAKVEAIQKTTQDQTKIGKEGQTVFTTARDAMKRQPIADCLTPAKNFAVQFFEERVAAYTALASGDRAGYDKHLADSEAARQNMIGAVNKVLGQ